MCSGLSRNYFQFVNGSFVVRMDPVTCHKIFYWYQFAINMIWYYNRFIFPLIEFMKCIGDKMEHPDYALYLADDPLLEEKRLELNVCMDDYSVTDEHCYKKCSTAYYNFDVKLNFLRGFKQALKSTSDQSSRACSSTATSRNTTARRRTR